jgi:SAM-dependent methyltransferase
MIGHKYFSSGFLSNFCTLIGLYLLIIAPTLLFSEKLSIRMIDGEEIDLGDTSNHVIPLQYVRPSKISNCTFGNCTFGDCTSQEFVNRFMRISDPKMDVVARIPLRSTWWSRPYEYAWAAQFAGSEYVVLDAACGISHPFKWLLAETCKETWACDVDPRIAHPEEIIQETYDDLGPNAGKVLTENPHLLERVKRLHCSICKLPNDLPKFDRIFCISTLEHMSVQDQQLAFAEFARVLAPSGLLIITFDYPVVTPDHLRSIAQAAGLIQMSDLWETQPEQDALNNGAFCIYRCVFKHA